MDIDLRELWIYPVTIVSGANQIVVSETGPSTGSATIPPGVYYAYLDDNAPAEFSTAYPSLYAALETAVNSAATGTYHLEIATPSVSTGFTNGGLQWVKDLGPAQVGFNVSDAGFTFPEWLLGLGAAGLRTPPHVSDYSRGGVWQSPRCRNSGFAGRQHVQFANNGGRETRQNRRWRTELARLFEYHWIPAGHVKHRANEGSGWASTAGLAQNDHGNYLADLHEHGLSKFSDIIVVHLVDQADIDITVFDLGAGWEIVSVLDADVAGDADAIIDLQERTGAHFGVDIPVQCMTYELALERYPDVASTYYRREV